MTITEHAAAGPAAPTITYQLSPSVRIDDIDETGCSLIQDLDDRRLLSLNPRTRAVIELFRRPRTLDEAVRDAPWRATREWWSAACHRLTESRILVTGRSPESRAAAAARAWRAGGWDHAADYLRSTYDYPFVDYSQASGHRIDRARMAAYVEERPDVERTKRYPGTQSTACEPTPAALALLDQPLGQVMGRSEPGAAELTADSLKTIMTVSFGRLRGRALRQPGRAPAIRRTSPSGGSRHPTEGYLLTSAVPAMRDGLHHFSTTEYTLSHIGTPGADQVQAAVGDAVVPPEGPWAMVIATSVFERNMYRYREPRTFRSVHLDVGHIIGTVELVAAHESLCTERLYRVGYRAVDTIVGLDPYVEATVCVITIGGAA